MSIKFIFGWNRTKIKDILHEDLYVCQRIAICQIKHKKQGSAKEAKETFGHLAIIWCHKDAGLSE